MSRVAIILTGPQSRAQAKLWVDKAPKFCRFELKESKRTLPQNALMWSLLTELARKLDWQGQRYSADDWKDYAMHALKRGRWMPSEDGGMVPIGMRTSDLSVEEMGDLIEFLHAFAARNGIVWDFDGRAEAAANNPASEAAA